MIVKPSSVKVSETPKPAPMQVSKPASVPDSKPAPVNPKPAPVQENLLKNHIGDQEVPNMCVSSDQLELIGSLAAGGSALRAAPGEEEEPPLDRVEESKQGGASGGDGDGADVQAVDGEVIPPNAPRRSEAEVFAQLRTIWDRGHVCDGKPKTIAAGQRAFAAARQHGAGKQHQNERNKLRRHVIFMRRDPCLRPLAALRRRGGVFSPVRGSKPSALCAEKALA
jgi:hypothetical protein